MNMAVRPPTETEMAAYNRSRKFHKAIAAKAATLAAPKGALASVVIAVIEPEAMPAATAPPAVAISSRQWFWPAGAEAFPQVRKIQDCVGQYYGVTRADLMSGRRMKEQIRPRHIAMYLSKQLTPLSLPSIGNRFGGRDHTTVLHAVRKIDALVRCDVATAHDVAVLVDVLTAGKGL